VLGSAVTEVAVAANSGVPAESSDASDHHLNLQDLQ